MSAKTLTVKQQTTNNKQTAQKKPVMMATPTKETYSSGATLATAVPARFFRVVAKETVETGENGC